MLKRLFVFWSFIVIANCCVAQGNLVPNPSFEVYDTCPGGPAQLSRAIGWNSYNGTPDYLNKCNLSGFSIPTNIYGYQNAINSDSGYVGIAILNNYNEVLGIKLLHPLIPNRKYFISFNLTPAYSRNLNITCFCNKIGIKFSTDSIQPQFSNPALINNFAHLVIDTLLTDTLLWFSFKTSFISDSSYTTILLGNFFTNNNYIYFCLDSVLFKSHYFIDRICVSEDSLTCFSSKVVSNPTEIIINFYQDENEFSIESVESSILNQKIIV